MAKSIAASKPPPPPRDAGAGSAKRDGASVARASKKAPPVAAGAAFADGGESEAKSDHATEYLCDSGRRWHRRKRCDGGRHAQRFRVDDFEADGSEGNVKTLHGNGTPAGSGATEHRREKKTRTKTRNKRAQPGGAWARRAGLGAAGARNPHAARANTWTTAAHAKIGLALRRLRCWSGSKRAGLHIRRRRLAQLLLLDALGCGRDLP
jgi:hypothetical protein